jgi:hypothetical protein
MFDRIVIVMSLKSIMQASGCTVDKKLCGGEKIGKCKQLAEEGQN